MFSPIGVALWQRIGDAGPGHQQEGPQHVDDAAEGYDQEGGAERDFMLIQNLKAEEDVWG